MVLGLLGAALAGLLVLASAASATSHHGVEPAFRISGATTDPPTPYQAFDESSLAAVDLTGDGQQEIVTHNDNKRGYIFGSDGHLIAELTTRHPGGPTPRPLGGPAVGDVTGNGVSDLVFVNAAAWVTAFEARPTDERELEITRLWETRMDPANQEPDGEWAAPATDAPPFLADTGGDGQQEVFAQLDDERSIYKLGSGGEVTDWTSALDGHAGPTVADLTDDGELESVHASDGGEVLVFDASSMQERCRFAASAHGAWPGSISTSPTLADLTSDGRLEMVFGVRNVPQQQYPGWEEDAEAHFLALDADCRPVWHRTWDWSNPHVNMQPVPVDVTGNGELDVVFQDWNTVGHKPGHWQHTGASNLFALEGTTGDLLWRTQVLSFWSNTGLAVTDLTGDGSPEILANEADGGDGLAIYSLDGSRKGYVAAPEGWLVTRGPVLAELDGDSSQELILRLHRDGGNCDEIPPQGCREGAIQVYDTPATGEPVHTNNEPLSLRQDSRPSTEGSGSFEPRFEDVRGNEWWIETDVVSEGSVASVHGRVDGGRWVALEHQDWGAWATDEPAPEGATVRFQARTSEGERALSGCYAWGQTPSPIPCPPPGDRVDATFTLVRGNPWWIETEVDSERAVTRVEVRIGPGEWRRLKPTDWSSWARNEQVPEGTIVQFRAHAGGQTATSDCYTWGTDPSTNACPAPADRRASVSFLDPDGNPWWIEVDVESSDAIASVSARVDGGEWFDLVPTDWGSWARNTHVGEDVTVEFRATNDAGAMDASAEIAWPPPE